MLTSQAFFNAQAWSPSVGHVVTQTEASTLSAGLEIDRASLLYCAAVSLVDAIRGLELEFYSWSTVKLYYCVFYAYRSILAANGISIVYEKRKPLIIEAKKGAVSRKASGTSHAVVLKCFAETFPNHSLLSQEIDLQPPHDWLMNLREEANYRMGRFWEPTCPVHLSAIQRLGIRSAITSYLNDGLFAFDADHAAVAYPLYAYLQARSHHRAGAALEERASRFLRKRIRDKQGAIAQLASQVLW